MTFLSWNLTVDLTSSTFATTLSPSLIVIGNLPIFTKTFPNNLGIIFIKGSDATKVS